MLFPILSGTQGFRCCIIGTSITLEFLGLVRFPVTALARCLFGFYEEKLYCRKTLTFERK